MTKPRLVKVRALFYVLQHITNRGCACFDTASNDNSLDHLVNVRTSLPVLVGPCAAALDLTGFAQKNNTIETVGFETIRANRSIGSLNYAFFQCGRLREIAGELLLSKAAQSFQSTFVQCVQLAEVRLKGLNRNVSFADSPMLSLGSLSYLVENAVNTSPITVAVHPDVFAKLTDEENISWHDVMAKALEREIQFITI